MDTLYTTLSSVFPGSYTFFIIFLVSNIDNNWTEEYFKLGKTGLVTNEHFKRCGWASFNFKTSHREAIEYFSCMLQDIVIESITYLCMHHHAESKFTQTLPGALSKAIHLLMPRSRM